MFKGNSENLNNKKNLHSLLMLEASSQVQDALEAGGYTVTSIDNFNFRCDNGTYFINYGELRNVIVKKGCNTILEFNPIGMEPISIVMMFHLKGIINLYAIPEFRKLLAYDTLTSSIPAVDIDIVEFFNNGCIGGNRMVSQQQQIA